MKALRALKKYKRDQELVPGNAKSKTAEPAMGKVLEILPVLVISKFIYYDKR